MNVNSKLLELENVTGLPTYPDKNESKSDEYITFNYADERDVLFGDDKPIEEAADMQVHVFVKCDYMDLKKKIKEFLINSGACGITFTSTYENETKKRHLIFEFEISEERS